MFVKQLQNLLQTILSTRPAARIITEALARDLRPRDRRWWTRVNPFQVFQAWYILFGWLRLMLVSLGPVYGWTTVIDLQHRHDLMIGYLVNLVSHGDTQPVFGVTIAPFLLLPLYLEYEFRVRAGNPLWSVFAELFVENPRRFWLLNREKFRPPLFTPYQSVRAFVANVGQIWNTKNGVRFHTAPLEYHRFASAHTRVRVNLLLHFTERVHWCAHRSALVVLTMVGLYHLIGAYYQLTTLRTLGGHLSVAVFDVWVSVATVNSMAGDTVFCGHCYLIYHFVLTTHLTELGRRLTAGSQCRNVPTTLATLARFRCEHTWAFQTMSALNHQLLSRSVAMVCLTTLPASVYVQSLLWTQQRCILLRTQLITGLAIQIGLTLIGVDTISRLTERLHRPHRSLFRAQLWLSRVATGLWPQHNQKLLREQVKSSFYYERLHCAHRFRFKLGTLGVISRWSMFKFLLAYFSFIFYLNKLFIKRVFLFYED